MPSKSRDVPPPIGTRASNKFAHPGKLIKTSTPRRTSAEVQQEREAKAKAKSDREEAKRKSIVRTAEFEQADMANEDFVNATPRPPFTPKQRPAPRNQKKAKFDPIAESPDVEIGGEDADSDKTPAASEDSVTEDESEDDSVTEDESVVEDESVTEDESVVEDELTAGDESAPESEDAAPPAKKKKVEVAKKATSTATNTKKAGTGKATKKASAGKATKTTSAGKGKKVDRPAEDEQVVIIDEEQTPKPKKVKVKVRDEIDSAAKKMENEAKGNKYGDMVRSMSSKKPEMPVPSQLQAGGGGRKLKREGAVADINALYKTVTPGNPDQNVMDIDDR